MDEAERSRRSSGVVDAREGIRGSPCQIDGEPEWQAALLRLRGTEEPKDVHAVHVLQGEIGPVVDHAGAEDLDDVRVSHALMQLCFASQHLEVALAARPGKRPLDNEPRGGPGPHRWSREIDLGLSADGEATLEHERPEPLGQSGRARLGSHRRDDRTLCEAGVLNTRVSMIPPQEQSRRGGFPTLWGERGTRATARRPERLSPSEPRSARRAGCRGRSSRWVGSAEPVRAVARPAACRQRRD